MRILIVDLDIFSAQGGGQTFYRRVVERHPGAQICYASRGRDLRRLHELPPNAMPFAIDAPGRDPATIAVLESAGVPSVAMSDADILCAIGRVQQGSRFDVVEVPSFRPCAHLVRPILGAHGIRVGRICVGMLGWVSVSLRKFVAPPITETGLAEMEAVEAATMRAADTCYTISALHAAENTALAASCGVVDMRDALEAFSLPTPEPPGEGLPDLWYVGRLDPAKAPDLFLEIAARLPRHLYHRLMLTGPDNLWVPAGERWSDELKAQARALGVEARIATSSAMPSFGAMSTAVARSW